MRFFISYSRAGAEDNLLAQLLRNKLSDAGQEVFVDTNMMVGTDWSAEIDNRIDWCDAMVVLLSEKSVASRMVKAEVRRAHRRRGEGNRPRILPVLVGYSGPLGYEIEAYLGNLQYLQWNNEIDTNAVVTGILDTAVVEPGLGEDQLVSPPIADAPLKTIDRPATEDKTGLMRTFVKGDGNYLVKGDVKGDVNQTIVKGSQKIVENQTIVKGDVNQTATSGDIYFGVVHRHK